MLISVFKANPKKVTTEEVLKAESDPLEAEKIIDDFESQKRSEQFVEIQNIVCNQIQDCKREDRENKKKSDELDIAQISQDKTEAIDFVASQLLLQSGAKDHSNARQINDVISKINEFATNLDNHFGKAYKVNDSGRGIYRYFAQK